MAVDTGLGGTITFGTSGFTGNMQEIGGETESVDELETSHLGTTDYKTHIASDLADPGEFECTIFWDAHVANSSPGLGVTEDITKTYPDSGASAATLNGDGFIKEFTRPPMQIGELMMATVVVRWGEGPTFTVGT